MKRKIAYYVFLAIGCLACKKNIALRLSDYEEAIVVDARISNKDSMYVNLSTTSAYGDLTQDSTLSGAKITIWDNTANKLYTLRQTPNGYVGGGKGTVAHNYTLSITYNNQVYTSTETMPSLVALDSVTFETKTILGKSIISAVVHFQDPSEETNYYRFRLFNPRLKRYSSFIFQDIWSNGKYINYTLQNDSSYYQIGDTVQVDMMSLTKSAFTFYKNVEFSSGVESSGSAKLTIASNAPTNVTNNALGLFDVNSSVDTIVLVK